MLQKKVLRSCESHSSGIMIVNQLWVLLLELGCSAQSGGRQ